MRQLLYGDGQDRVNNVFMIAFAKCFLNIFCVADCTHSRTVLKRKIIIFKFFSLQLKVFEKKKPLRLAKFKQSTVKCPI
jgi:hypothetical protein